jgi:chromosome partitioning protein
MIILIGSEKGGVGKSTLATNIVAFLAIHNKDVILVDADRQSTSANWVHDRKSTKKKQIECVRQYDDIEDTLRNLSKRYDFIVADCQGRDSKELRTGLMAADIFIVPCRPSQPDLDTVPIVASIVKSIKSINKKLEAYCVLTMSPTNPAVKEIKDSKNLLEQYSDLKLLETTISDRKIYRDAIAVGLSVIETSNEKAKTEIENLVNEILKW